MKAKLGYGVTLFAFFTLFALPNSFAQLEVPLANVPFDTANIPEPVPPPAAVRDFFELDPFYQQWINVRGFPVLASAKVSPYAVKEVAYLIYQITRHSPAALQAMVENKVRFSIIAHNERTTEIPEHSIHPEPHFFYDMRNRGGYCSRCSTVSAPEETVLDEGWYSVTIHEFAHAFHEAGLNTIDPAFENKLRTTYNAAMERGLWHNTYSSTNRSEYWAQGVGTWFNANPSFKTVPNRRALKNYDPGLSSLLTEVFGDSVWHYTLPATRVHLPHLQGFNSQKAPRLQHPPELLETYRQFTSNPANDGRGKWVNLKPHDPSQLPILNRSRATGDSISIYFMNHTGATVSVYQVHPDGQEIHRRNVVHRNFNELRANIGSILLVKDDTGKEFAVFSPDEGIRGFIVRAFVGTPDVPLPTVQPPVVAEVPETGTWLAVEQPPGLSAANLVINPGAFAIFVHKNQPSVSQPADFNTYRPRSLLGDADFPNLADFFQNGGRIELVSHPSKNPLPPNAREPQLGDVVISEIMWGLNGSAQGKQYIELYNASAHTYTFANGDLMFRFSKASEEPLPEEIFAPPFNTKARLKVIDKVSNKTWKVPGQSGNISQNRPLISMYRVIDYTTGNTPEGTLASSWKESTGRVNLSVPSYGTPGAVHLPPRTVVQVESHDHPPLYWIDTASGTLYRLVGTEVESLAPGVQNATDLAIDMTDSKLYWTERTSDRTGKIRRASLDGTNVQLVKELTSVPHGIALDAADGKIYLTNSWGKVQRLNVDGSNFESNLVTGLGDLKDIAVDVVNHKVYWTEQTGENTGGVRRADLDGSNVELVKALNNVPHGITVDPSNGKLYLTNSRGKVQWFTLDGSNFEWNFIVDLNAPQGIAVDVAEGKIYWTEKTGIRRANLDGTNIQDVVTGSGFTNIVLGTPVVMDDMVTVASPPTDINEDGRINVSDLLLVVTALQGSETANPRADVNADGAVTTADLLLVIENLDDPVNASAPMSAETITSLDKAMLEPQLNILLAQTDGSLRYQQAIAFLQTLLATTHPNQTRLLANYPNPFNPETWIPYQLADSSDVRILIYDTKGTVVRHLELGHQPAGYYTSRNCAAYWDGRNTLGERIASGIYFYQLQVDDLSLLRKMIVLK